MVDPKLSPPKRSYRERFNHLLAEWGALVLWVYFGIFAIVLVGFALAIKFGFGVESAAGTAGTWGAAWVATKLTQPLRIAATLILTPAFAALLRRVRKQGPPGGTPSALDPVATSAESARLEPTEPSKP
jgi:hypothetical protein